MQSRFTGSMIAMVMVLSSGVAKGQTVEASPEVISEAEDRSIIRPPPSAAVLQSAANPNAADPEPLIARWIAAAIPLHYDKKEDWGRTKDITVGVEASSRGLKLRLRRKKKPVRHGVWKHYRLSVVDPDAIRVYLTDLRVVERGRVAATVRVSLPLHGWARMRIYRLGIHLGTFTAEGRSDVHLQLACELGLRLEAENGVPMVVVDPHVQRARLDLRDLQLSRISNADGPVVRELGSGLKCVVEEELEPRKLTEKLNRAIAKKRDRLRWNPQQLLREEWVELVSQALPGTLEGP